MAKPLIAITVLAVLAAGIFAISIQDVEAKVTGEPAKPIKRVQIKIIDLVDEPLSELGCGYVYDSLDRRIIQDFSLNKKGVANIKLVPPPSDGKVDIKCESGSLFGGKEVKLDDDVLTKIDLELNPLPIIPIPQPINPVGPQMLGPLEFEWDFPVVPDTVTPGKIEIIPINPPRPIIEVEIVQLELKSVSPIDLEPGVYDWRIRAQDNDGNFTPWSELGPFEIIPE